MKKNKSLEDKIVQGIYIFETKRVSHQLIIRFILLLLIIFSILVFGGVIGDLLQENGISNLIEEFVANGEYTYFKANELLHVFMRETPTWLITSYSLGFMFGIVLIISLIKNRKVYYHKLKSLIQYWSHL